MNLRTVALCVNTDVRFKFLYGPNFKFGEEVPIFVVEYAFEDFRRGLEVEETSSPNLKFGP